MAYVDDYIAQCALRFSPEVGVLHRGAAQDSAALLRVIKGRIARTYCFDTDAFYYTVGLTHAHTQNLLARLLIGLSNIQKYTIAATAAVGVAIGRHGFEATFLLEQVAATVGVTRKKALAQLAVTTKTYAASYKGADGIALTAVSPTRALELLRTELLGYERNVQALAFALGALVDAGADFEKAELHEVLQGQAAATALVAVAEHTQADTLHTQAAVLDVIAATGLLELHINTVDPTVAKYDGAVTITGATSPRTLALAAAPQARTVIRPGDFVYAGSVLVGVVSAVLSEHNLLFTSTQDYVGPYVQVRIAGLGSTTYAALRNNAAFILETGRAVLVRGFVADAAWLYANANTGLGKYMTAHNLAVAALTEWQQALLVYQYNKVSSVDHLFNYLREERLGNVVEALLHLQFVAAVGLDPPSLSQHSGAEDLLEELAATFGGESAYEGAAIGDSDYASYTQRPANTLFTTAGTPING